MKKLDGEKLHEIDLKLKRWRTRLKRAITMIDKLEKQKNHLDRKLTRQQIEREMERERLKQQRKIERAIQLP